MVINVLSGPLLIISSFYKACFSARVPMKQVFVWSHDYVLVQNWLFRSVTSFVSVRGYSGGSFIRLHLICCPDSSTLRSALLTDVFISSLGFHMFRYFIQTDGGILPQLGYGHNP
jgi:hypothetical protein